MRPVREPIFIWGAGRTGSYLLYDLVTLHPDVICARASERDHKGLYGTQHHGKGDFDGVLDNPFPPIEAAKRHILRPFPALNHQDFGTQPQLPHEQLTEIEKAFRLTAAATLRPRRLVDKSPHYTFLVPVLETIFPDALHIQCVRHPAAVATSYVRRMREPDSVDEFGFWGWRPDGWQALKDASLETKAVWLVTRTMRKGRENIASLGPRGLDVRYEDLTARPLDELRRALRHLRLPEPAGLAQSLPSAFPNYNSTNFDLGTVDAQVRAEFEALVRELGYAE